MKVGTADIIEDIPEPKRKRSGLSGGSNTPGGGGQNPGGGGGDNPYKDEELDEKRFVPAKARILTAFLLLIVLMTFGGLIAAYVVIATNGVAEWQPFALPIPVWISTAIILLSSITYHFGKTAIERNDHERTKKVAHGHNGSGSCFYLVAVNGMACSNRSRAIYGE